MKTKTTALILITALSLTISYAGDLNRDMAKTILAQKLSTPHIGSIRFTETGYQKAEQDNLVKPPPMFGTASATFYTQEGKSFFDAIIDKDSIDGGGAKSIALKTKMAEEVVSVDGIVDSGNGKKIAEFTTAYIFPKNTPPEVKSYFYSGRKASATFALYDNGWRIIEE